MLGADPPDLAVARGHWLRRDLIAWPADDPGVDPAGLDWTVHWSQAEPIDPAEPEPVPWGTAVLSVDPTGLPAEVVADVPHLRGYVALRVPDEVPVADALCGQLVVSAHFPSGRLATAGGLQLPHVLDELYATAAGTVLGAEWSGGVPTLRLWAPTARQVRLLLWEADGGLRLPGRPVAMDRRPDGTWEVVGDRSWTGARYRYEVTVFAPGHRRVVANQVTDPYSIALTVNSTHSVLVDLDDPSLAPEIWATPSPVLAHPVDQVLYELHVRDFSISDKTVPEELRGSFLAFTRDSAGMAHLRRLAGAGLTTVQLLPVFDNASVEESPEAQQVAGKDWLKSLPPDSPDQQREVTGLRRPAYNWGYDPWHWFAPEGSYASTPAAADGAGRVVEFRAAVGALHAAGLRVVLDQVFNHTASSGQDSHSVLDRIVPGYYHRLTACGQVETSTCCANIATEHLMAGKLMVDACVLWARHYRVDGFRFDLMGHHSRDNLLAVRNALDALTPERDGVDGHALTLHGEGWDFGEVAGNSRFVQASQGQLGGTGIATFSDRLRDAVRGGGAFDPDPRGQGFGTGLGTAWNGVLPERNLDGAEARLAYDTDLVQLALAGTLRSYRFASNSLARTVRGDELDYRGGPAGYADEPEEVIGYVDAHDNETLFDALTLKLPVDTPMRDRVRLNTLCLALATLGQSPVMWHAGTDLLRSKSLDRNSYSSGDWFNFLDFSMTDNGFAAGLPPERDNGPTWHLLRPLLADPALKPAPEDIRFAHAMALDLLRLRASTRLFRLRTAAAIARAVEFPVANTAWQQPGVIVMVLGPDESEPGWRRAAVVFNASPHQVAQQVPFPAGGYALHPVQQAGVDDRVTSSRIGQREFVVPGLTAAVFVEPRVKG